MSKLIKLTIVKLPVMVSQLTLDADPNAERYAVIDRRSFKPVVFGKVEPNVIVKRIAPAGYATSGDAMVMIVDDDKQYNAKVADGVTLEAVDINPAN